MRGNEIVAGQSWGPASTLHARRHALAEAVVAAQYRDMPEHFQTIDDHVHNARVEQTKSVLEQLAQAMALTDPILFLDHVAWMKSALGARGVPLPAIRRSLQLVGEVLEDELTPDTLVTANTLIRQAVDRLEQMPDAPRTVLGGAGPLAETASAYCRLVLAGDKEGARTLILRQVDAGTPVESILLNVFEPVQRELGRLWQTAQIDIAQEHFATHVTQRLMAQLAARFGRSGDAGTLVAACVEDELHDVGLRLLADLFQVNGWNVHFLGADTPKPAILSAVEKHKPDVVALSVTISYRTWHLADVIGDLRRLSQAADALVMVGGYPFIVSPSLADWIGADAGAANAAQAFQTVERLRQQASA